MLKGPHISSPKMHVLDAIKAGDLVISSTPNNVEDGQRYRNNLRQYYFYLEKDTTRDWGSTDSLQFLSRCPLWGRCPFLRRQNNPLHCVQECCQMTTTFLSGFQHLRARATCTGSQSSPCSCALHKLSTSPHGMSPTHPREIVLCEQNKTQD